MSFDVSKKVVLAIVSVNAVIPIGRPPPTDLP
jgi:hypothetical protein